MVTRLIKTSLGREALKRIKDIEALKDCGLLLSVGSPLEFRDGCSSSKHQDINSIKGIGFIRARNTFPRVFSRPPIMSIGQNCVTCPCFNQLTDKGVTMIGFGQSRLTPPPPWDQEEYSPTTNTWVLRE